MLAMGFNPIASSCIEECIASPVFVGALGLTRVPHYVMLLARIIGTFPTANATGVAPTTNVTATFSEDMLVSSINGNTFKLQKGLDHPAPRHNQLRRCYRYGNPRPNQLPTEESNLQGGRDHWG